MGRRKIEIKAIKDDRNRSVTFLKRKGGLFKKAHELSVLCSVDVAVIIFGNNKKLYEYSSSDLGEILQRHAYYGQPNEHKGPADFNGKKDLDDDDDDDMGSPPGSNHSQEAQMMPPQFQNQPAYQHIRHHTPSASPPIGNGAFHPGQRQHTPQPQMGSRPSSRNAPRRQSSGLVHQHPNMQQQQGPPQQVNGYGYMPQPAMYNGPNGPIMPHPQPGHPQAPQFQYPPPPPPQHQLQQVYMEMDDQRRSLPPQFKMERPASVGPMVTPPQPQPQQLPQHQNPQPEHQQSSAQQQQIPPQAQMAEPVKRLSVKSRSIFTPIDESRSILSQHWQSSTTASDNIQPGLASPPNRSQSVDVGSVSRSNGAKTNSPRPPARAQTHAKRNPSLSSVATDAFTPPSRTNSGTFGKPRPRLKVQIPDEASDNDGGDSGSPQTDTAATGSDPSRRSEHSSGVVLPPPSPSASALLSAGASGPPNPFARPHPPNSSNNNSGNNTNNIETPVSALPSRFMNNEFLPSPSSFYPEWNFRGGDGNTLPSPLNFATPVIPTGLGFGGREERGEKRKSVERDGEGEGSAGGETEAKRVKVD